MRSRKTALLCMVIFFTSMTVTGCKKKDEAGRYYSRNKGYSIKIPDSWDTKKAYLGTDIVAVSPSEGPDDDFHENFNVMVQPLNESLTVDQFYQKSIPGFKTITKEFREHSHGYVELDGKKARWDILSHKMGPLTIKVLAYITIHSTNGYVITFSSSEAKFSRYEEMFKNIADTFRFE